MTTLEEFFSVTRDLQLLDEVRKNLRERMESLRIEAILEALYYDWDRPTEDQILVGTQECAESPVRVCVYHSIQDPSRQSCLFCHTPEGDPD
jgi:hypothetical protein